MNPVFFMFHASLQLWFASFEAMQFAMSEIAIVRPPPKLVLIRGGKAR
jgi:hypothetical protein